MLLNSSTVLKVSQVTGCVSAVNYPIKNEKTETCPVVYDTALKPPTHRRDSNQRPPAFIRPLRFLSSDPEKLHWHTPPSWFANTQPIRVSNGLRSSDRRHSLTLVVESDQTTSARFQMFPTQLNTPSRFLWTRPSLLRRLRRPAFVPVCSCLNTPPWALGDHTDHL